jgi:hypothetical protein
VCGPAHTESFSPSSGAEQREIFQPGTDRLGILAPHDSGDLSQMIKIVGYPGGEELTQAHQAQLRMASGTVQVPGLEPEGLQPAQVAGAELRKGVEQLVQRLALRVAKLGKAIERSERIQSVRSPWMR